MRFPWPPLTQLPNFHVLHSSTRARARDVLPSPSIDRPRASSTEPHLLTPAPPPATKKSARARATLDAPSLGGSSHFLEPLALLIVDDSQLAPTPFSKSMSSISPNHHPRHARQCNATTPFFHTPCPLPPCATPRTLCSGGTFRRHLVPCPPHRAHILVTQAPLSSRKRGAPTPRIIQHCTLSSTPPAIGLFKLPHVSTRTTHPHLPRHRGPLCKETPSRKVAEPACQRRRRLRDVQAARTGSMPAMHQLGTLHLSFHLVLAV